MSRPGHLITRRQSLGLAGVGAAAFVAGVARNGDSAAPAGVAEAQAPSCVLVPEVTEGPYFVDNRLRRSDLRSNSSGGGTREGIPLTLKITIVEVSSGGRIASRGVSGVGRGTRAIRLSVPGGVAAGPALLVVAFRDASGNAKVARRRVRIPRGLS